MLLRAVRARPWIGWVGDRVAKLPTVRRCGGALVGEKLGAFASQRCGTVYPAAIDFALTCPVSAHCGIRSR